MTYAQFIEECSNRTIHASVAKENARIKEALRNRDDAEVLRLLDTEF